MEYSKEKTYSDEDHSVPVMAKEHQAPVANTLEARRRAALDELDNAAFNRYHVKAVAVACVGFLTDAYDIFAISLAATMIGYVYGKQTGGIGKNTANQDLGLKVSHSIGTFMGQLGFGYLADRVGRKRMYGLELMVIIIGTLGTAVAGRGPGASIYGVLIMWRFIMGIGIGGDYPLSATISAEFAGRRIRGRMMTATFAGQGWGNLLAAIVGLCAVTGFRSHIEKDTTFKYVDICWRILLGMGCVPGAIALYYRLTISETPRYTLDVDRDVDQAAKDVSTFLASGKFEERDDVPIQRVEVPKASWADFRAHFGQWKNGKVLLGTSVSWFVLDVAFYGLGLNTSTVLTAIGFGSATTGTATQKIATNLHNVAVGNIILALGGLIPGYWLTFAFIDKWGRKPIQLMGFSILTVLFCIMGFGYHKLMASTAGKHGLVVLYCLCNLFQNFGPNTTTFVIPGEVFPTRYRSTAHGISAASGKLGAIIAQVGFARLVNIGGTNAFLPHILQIFALFMLIGVFSTLLLPETMGKSLEELSGDDYEENQRQIERHEQ